MTLKQLIDEDLAADPKLIMAQLTQLQQLDKNNANTLSQLKNSPDLQKSFQPFQQLVQQQLEQKKKEAMIAQQQQQQQQQQQNQQNGQQPAVANGSPVATTTPGTAVVANQ